MRSRSCPCPSRDVPTASLEQPLLALDQPGHIGIVCSSQQLGRERDLLGIVAFCLVSRLARRELI